MTGGPRHAILGATAAFALAATAAAAPLVDVPPPAPQHVLSWLPPNARPLGAGTGTQRVEQNAIRETFELSAGRETPSPIEVEYSVDPDVEAQLREVLDEHGVALGHVILMDAQSGDLLAYVATAPDEFPATRAYPMASLMKVVTAAALLREDPEAKARPCTYEGNPYELRLAHLQPPLAGLVQSFRRSLAISNNQCFARLAVHQVGEEALLREMHGLGLLAAPAEGHAAGEVSPLRGALSLGHLGSGLAGSSITPLGAARLAAVLARGELVEPRWVAAVRDVDGLTLSLPERQAPHPVWSQALVRNVREAMIDVTEGGTARRAFRRGGQRRLGPVRVAGKTGTRTGTQPPGRYRWFIGAAPAEAPRIAIATLVVDSGGSGASAARISAEVLEAVFCRNGACESGQAHDLLARTQARSDRARREIVAQIRERERQRDLDRAFETVATHDVVALDQPPRPVGETGFDLPRRLRHKEANGQIVLLVDLSQEGEVLDVEIASSDLPDFEEFVMGEVRRWSFTPPTRDGRPVRARARLPIGIQLNSHES